MVVAKRIANYEGFGSNLNTDVSFLQAASLLDVASKYAIESKDVERLENIAVLWMELARRIDDIHGEHPGEPEPDEAERIPLGFAGKGVEIVEPDDTGEVESEEAHSHLRVDLH